MLVSDIKVLSVDDIAAVIDRKEELFPVPEWGGAIKLRALSLTQRDAIQSACIVNGVTNDQQLIHHIVIAGVVEPVLTEAFIAERSFAVIDRISKRIMD